MHGTDGPGGGGGPTFCWCIKYLGAQGCRKKILIGPAI